MTTAYDPEDRFTTVDELHAALYRALQSGQAQKQAAQRNAHLVWQVLTICVVLVVIATLLLPLAARVLSLP